MGLNVGGDGTFGHIPPPNDYMRPVAGKKREYFFEITDHLYITDHRSPKERFHRRRDMQAAQYIRSQASRLWTLKLAEREEVGASRSFCGEGRGRVLVKKYTRSFFFEFFCYYK